jgi:putative transcription factor
MQCEMCGTDGELFKVNIEGVNLNICRKCAKFGKVIERVKEPSEIRARVTENKRVTVAKQAESETVFVITADYSAKIKTMREKLGLKQEELAKKINERDTLIHKIETGGIEPNIILARKLEKFLGIKLVEEHSEESKELPAIKKGDVTIGDLARIKKR